MSTDLSIYCPNCTMANGDPKAMSSAGCYEVTANGIYTWRHCPTCGAKEKKRFWRFATPNPYWIKGKRT